MASKKTLNESNLESLGAKRLAELLMQISTGNAAAKRLLRLELAGAESPGEAAREIRKRLAAIARAKTFVDSHKHRDFARDLEAQRSAITDRVAKTDPVQALELMWRFLDLAQSVYDRCDDSNGEVGDIFQIACEDLGRLARAAKPAATDLADQAYAALTANAYGQFDSLIQVLTPALGPQGLEHLKQRMTALSKQKVEKPQGAARKAVAWSSRGPIYADEMAEISRVNTTRAALREIADAQGDVDAYIAQYDSKTRKVPNIAAEIAERLLTAGRAKEALHFIDAAEVRQTDWIETEWEDARINVLDALGRGAEAQAARLSCFERALSASHLRAYLKRLADFDDLEAEEKALGTAERYQHFHHALSFLIGWPDLARAARMVIQRPAEMNGKHYDILTPAADALAEKYPLSATLLLRAMIDFALVQSRATRYGHAARHLMECTRLAAAIRDFAAFETHAAYVARLHREHPKKAAFWNLMPG